MCSVTKLQAQMEFLKDSLLHFLGRDAAGFKLFNNGKLTRSLFRGKAHTIPEIKGIETCLYAEIVHWKDTHQSNKHTHFFVQMESVG